MSKIEQECQSLSNYENGIEQFSITLLASSFPFIFREIGGGGTLFQEQLAVDKTLGMLNFG